jgi:hypothetical protein
VKDISVSCGSFRRGWKMVSATLIHEIAHVNGASGDKRYDTAESTFYRCGMTEDCDSDVYGFLKSMPANAVMFS